jgi:hypothetical protein
VSKHVGHKAKIVLFANWTARLSLRAHVRRRTYEFRMCIAHLVSSQSSDTDLIDQHSSGESMINNATLPSIAAYCSNRKGARHRHGMTLAVLRTRPPRSVALVSQF